MKNIISIIRLAKPLYPLVGILAFLITIGAAIELVAPILSKFIVDEIVIQVQTQTGNFQKLAFLIGVVFAANLVSIALTAVSERLGDHFSAKLRKFLTETFYEKVLTLPQSYFDSEVSGRILNQLARAISSISQFSVNSTNFILPTLLQSVFTIFVLAYFHKPIAFFTFLLFPIYLYISYIENKKWGQMETKKNVIEDNYRSRIYQVIGNIKLVRTFMREEDEIQTASKKIDASNRIYAQQSRMYHTYDFLRNLSLITIIVIINIFAFYSAFSGIITLGTLVLIIQMVNAARRPLFAMSFIFNSIQMAETGSREYFAILSLKSKEDFKKKIALPKLKNPQIEFKNVSFKYKKGETVLDDVSFKIPPRQKVALVGESGAGKTTIVNLICKFYEQKRGTIFLDGKSYKKLDHKFVRNNISLVFQEAELFSATIRENVAYAHPQSSKTQIVNALKRANAWDFIKNFPKGLDSQIGERGVRLSGGQKQRIQIARAILKDAPILILDEATSHLDAKSEMEVQTGLENLMREKLVIIIAHRFSTIQNVHRILVIDQGKIVQEGTPGELAQKKGIYSDLLKFQIAGNKKLLEKFEIY